jgi:hypothetical protein
MVRRSRLSFCALGEIAVLPSIANLPIKGDKCCQQSSMGQTMAIRANISKVRVIISSTPALWLNVMNVAGSKIPIAV